MSAQAAENAKFRKYSSDAATHNQDLYPIAFESQGAWGSISSRFFKTVLERLHILHNPDHLSLPSLSKYWRLQINLSLHKWISLHIMHAHSNIASHTQSLNPTPITLINTS